MIDFVGFLTGAAEKAFVRKTRQTVLLGFCIVIPLTLPSVFFIGIMVLRDNAFIYAMLAALLLSVFIILVPKGKKEHMAMLPKRIYIHENCIVCVADRYTDIKRISDVQRVIDHGAFYELKFPFGKYSDKFICQKDLLTKGSLGEFEKLFKGKIFREFEATTEDSVS